MGPDPPSPVGRHQVREGSAGTSPGGRSVTGPSVHAWLLAAALLLVLGTIGSVWGAEAVARNAKERSHAAFVASSTDIASTLKLAIQHEQDLVISAGAFAVGNPGASQSDFLKWTASVQAFARYPEVLGIAELTVVPQSQLATFAARAMTDPAGSLAADGTFQVTPTGVRPFYCLATASQSRAGTAAGVAGLDYCATELGGRLLKARDSGLGAYAPYGSGSGAVLVLGTPLYVGGVVPGTVEARRQVFIGWTGTSTRPDMILKTAIGGHPATAVSLSYGAGAGKVSFRAGTVPVGAQSTTVDLQSGWHVVVYGLVTGGGIVANKDALALLLGGLVLFLLLATVIYLLVTSRSRAILLVNERTEQLRYQAFHDPLTGLPNRTLVLDRIAQMMARSRRDRVPVAAMFLDLDNFKDINDTLGHDAGDQVLVGVATRLAGLLREADTIGRLGGDEFVILIEGESMTDGSEAAAERVLDALHGPLHVEGATPLDITASIGIATGTRASPEELLRDADIALYRAKGAGKDRVVLFTQSMQDAVDDHRYLDVDLHRALDAGEFFLLYQPIVDLASGVTTGVEALLRWRHPGRGIVQPEDFIPALESSGLIVPVGTWVLTEACRQGAEWQRSGHHLGVSVNVAAAQLEQDRIVDDVHDALAASGFDPGLLTLELTETTLMHDVRASIGRLELLKAIGLRLAIDDFGTGYSSMAYLQQFPIDVLKIDRSFVSRISGSAESAALVHTLVQLGKVLGIAVTAEGVETDDQRNRLKSEGVDNGQGNLFARPFEAQVVSHFLDESEDGVAGAADGAPRISAAT